ncbi:MAG: aminotransferase class I/II-fold pyridoxal phosphate-dependent enzyme [bacterium]
MHISRRLSGLPPYLAADIAARVAALRREGAEVIDLSVGSPDLTPDEAVLDAARRALDDPGAHGYVIGRGHPDLRRAAAGYMGRRFGVPVDPDTQVLALLGSKEGLGHLPIALCEPGDVGVHPDPAYPVYRPSLLLAGARPVALRLKAEEGWKPDWEGLEEETGGDPVRLIILNFPHNPTSATAELEDFDEAVDRARERDAVLVNDNAYADIGFDGYRPPSILQAARARGGEAGSGVVEYHSMSKAFSMAGWRCGFAVGDPEVIGVLARLKSFYDTGLFQVVQQGAAAALDRSDAIAASVSRTYQGRRDRLKEALAPLGLEAQLPRATIYLWARLPEGAGEDADWCRRVLEEAHVALSPGSGYGPAGRGYVRLSLTEPEEVLDEVVDRLQRFAGSP